MSVHIDCDLNRRVAELVAHVRERLALLDEQRRERVSQVVNPDLAQLRLGERLRPQAVDSG